MSQFPDWASGAACKTDSEQRGQECACLLGPRSVKDWSGLYDFRFQNFAKDGLIRPRLIGG